MTAFGFSGSPYRLQKTLLAQHSRFIFQHIALDFDFTDDKRVIRRSSNDFEGFLAHDTIPSPRLVPRPRLLCPYLRKISKTATDQAAL